MIAALKGWYVKMRLKDMLISILRSVIHMEKVGGVG